jgi:hypothetical protein
MKTKYFLVFLVLLLSQIIQNNASAQRCLSFNYDADGNRISKKVLVNCFETKDNLEVEENQEDTEFSVYPNPTDGSFKIIIPESIQNESVYCLVYDINGALIIETKLSGETDVDIGNVPRGVYLLKIINGVETFSRIIVKN